MVNARSTSELPLYRLYLLRALFLLIALGQGSQTWPGILHHTRPLEFWHGVALSFLGALTLLSLLGVRYPVRMLPLLIFEFRTASVNRIPQQSRDCSAAQGA